MVNILKEILQFSKSQQNGLIILFIILMAVSYFSTIKRESDSYSNIQPIPQTKNSRQYIYNKTIRNFVFNPNSASKLELFELGFEKRTIAIIEKYKLHGGKFYYKSDLKRIYTFHDSIYSRLEYYIDLPDKPKFKLKKYFVKKNKDSVFNKKTEICLQINLNNADTNELKKIPFIGTKRATHILKYRTSLGGFVDISQLQEIYSIDKETFNKITNYFYLETDSINRIELNNATIKDLEKHPYLSYVQAKDIIEYRQIIVRKVKVADLLRDKIIDSTTYFRIKPYLKDH